MFAGGGGVHMAHVALRQVGPGDWHVMRKCWPLVPLRHVVRWGSGEHCPRLASKSR
jgi:hypothetical protein